MGNALCALDGLRVMLCSERGRGCSASELLAAVAMSVSIIVSGSADMVSRLDRPN
eukprot:SAG11_NODE_41218_length_196_cov_254.340206_1_plen_54_part_10